MKELIITLFALSFQGLSITAKALEVFDMDAMRDPDTLEIEVLQDWRTVKGPNIATRQKLVTINVGEIWPGQDYRLPVRMVGACGSQSARVSSHRWKCTEELGARNETQGSQSRITQG